MAEVRDQLVSLLRIQELILEVQAARAVVDAAPGRRSESEGRFRERNAEYVAIKERHDAVVAEVAARSEEQKALDEQRRKYMDSLMQVKNQREYAAALKEIDTVKMRIAENDEAILKGMEERDTLQPELESRAGHIEQERALVGEEHSAIDAEVAAAEATIARCEAERRTIETGLPAPLVQSVRRIEEGRRGVFLVKCDREMCTACHVRVRPQVFQEIRAASKLHVCSNCKRFLYFEPALRGPDASGPAAGVQTVQDGAA